MPFVPLTIGDLRGGRNGIDSPVSPNFPIDQCVEAQNIDFSRAPLGARRGGSDNVSLNGGTAIGANQIQWLFRHLPTGDEADAELWKYVAGLTLFKRLAGGINWADVTSADVPTVDTSLDATSFNGKLVIASNFNNIDRLHTYDPQLAAPTIRRHGLAASAAPTVANQGVGAYAATQRWYRTRSLQLNGTVIVRRSEPSPSVAFTPSGAGLSARVTRAAAPGENETHWELEASPDNINFYTVQGSAPLVSGAAIAIGTTFFDDTVAVATYSTFSLSDPIGYYTLVPACRFLTTDGNRLIAASGLFNGKTSRVYITTVLGSADTGDDERMVQTATRKPYYDLNEKVGGGFTGVSSPVNGVFYIFKSRQVWRFIPTDDFLNPYSIRQISDVVGSVNDRSIVNGEDAFGNPVVYFLSYRGPYRVGPNGLEYLGRDIEDQWYGLNGLTSIWAYLSTIGGFPWNIPHGLYYGDVGQVWWWIPSPGVRLRFDVRRATRKDQYGIRGGWSIDRGGDAIDSLSSTMFSDTLGAQMSHGLKPYFLAKSTTATNKVYKGDTTSSDDNGTAFQAYIKTRSLAPHDQLGRNFEVSDSILIAKVQANTTIRLSIIRDFGAGTVSGGDASLAATGTEDHVLSKFSAGGQSDIGVLQIQLGDSGAVSVAPWWLDAISLLVTETGDR